MSDPGPAAEAPAMPLLAVRDIHKRFPGVLALAGVNFDLRAGEVHALLGQNGAGKSTLIKVLTGAVQPDAGTMALNGRAFRAASPAAAQRLGIATVHQELNLAPSLSVAENLLLGRFPRGWWGIAWGRMRREAQRLLAPFDLRVDVAEPLGSYPIAIQQMVAIARALALDARLIILDEPTSSLDARETDVLLGIIRRLRERGLGIIFVTHFLDQVYRVSDRITVLRNGRLIGTFAASLLSKGGLVAHMLGRAVGDEAAGRALPAAAALHATLGMQRERALAGASRSDAGATSVGGSGGPSPPYPPILRARRLGRRGAVEPTDLEIHRGEVLGLAGLLGAGRTELARLLFGADRADSGRVEVRCHDRSAAPAAMTPRRAIALGLAFCPEDRKADGLFGDMSVRDNLTLVMQRRLSRLGFVNRRALNRIAEGLVRRLGIRTPDLDRPVRQLSGGNQQKVILARWLACEPAVLILDEPTRGIDVGAKAELETLIQELSAGGMAILFISAELDELARRCHRIVALSDRRKVGELTGPQIPEAAILRLIAGQN